MFSVQSLVYSICIFALATMVACHPNDKTQDVDTAKLKSKDCVNQLTVQDSNRGTYYIDRSSELSIPTSGITSGSKRILKLYNHLTCDSIIETDYFFNTDSYFSVNGDTSGLNVVSGQNRIDFEVQECQTVEVSNGYTCVNQITKDSGYFIITVK